MVKIVGVRFRNAGKVYYFDPGELELKAGNNVIVETSKGPEYGTVSTPVKMVQDDQVSQPLRAVVRTAAKEDDDRLIELRKKEKEALKVCREKARERGLEMKIVGAEIAFDGSKMLFYFTADGRVDFRELVRDLASAFHMRIELRQIGVRDETRMLGGIGTCGRELCCATYLRDFQPVSIKMAKEQNLSLNPSKISGVCGRLLCCLKNEEETYSFLNASMPKLGAEAVTADGQSGKVIELDVLRQRVKVLFEEGDTKEAEVFPVEQLTFHARKKGAPAEKSHAAGDQGKAGSAQAKESAADAGNDNADQVRASRTVTAKASVKDAVAADAPMTDAADAETRKRKPRRKNDAYKDRRSSGKDDQSRGARSDKESGDNEGAAQERGTAGKNSRRRSPSPRKKDSYREDSSRGADSSHVKTDSGERDRKRRTRRPSGGSRAKTGDAAKKTSEMKIYENSGSGE